ncbi:alpha/beta hydrolase [Roseicella sp. DB1501]|uniref:alpha/beta hydrolase n=1 Tax=Roseicella sp. DB1501 TaxID=2730925 RepID=UPI001492956A|nr:alpha/beta hydrolase [Roseicella sp. DB1501]NOG73287.1 alpha/beta hydrolase [Roseicella sp. DB1501]
MRQGVGRRAFARGAGAGASLLLAGCIPGGLPDLGGPEVQVERDIAYAPRAEALLDAYHPVAATEPLPVIVYFHGGGWQVGRKDELQDMLFARRLAARGAVVISANYRLAPEACYPNFLEDGAGAAVWAHRNAARLGGDPARIYFAGHSAGAYNAVKLAVDRNHVASVGLPRDAVQGAIGIAGLFTERCMDWPLLNAVFPPNVRAVAPATRQLGPDTPPLLLLAGSLDFVVPPRETRLLAEAARAAGTPVKAIVYPGFGHLDLLASAPWLPSAAPVLRDISRFIGAQPLPAEQAGTGQPRRT